MLLELMKGVALLLALCYLHGFVVRWSRGTHGSRAAYEPVLSGVLFGGICVVGMMAPLQLAPGLIFDARSVVLSMSGLFGGPVVGVIAGLIAGGYRFWLGGAGVGIGVAVVVACVALGLAYRHGEKKGWVALGPIQFLVFGLVVHLVTVLLFAQLPAELAKKVLENVALPFVLTFTPATALLGMLLQDVKQRSETEQALIDNEARLRAIGAALPDILFVLDEDGRYVEVLSSAESLLYAEVSKVLGRRMHEVLPVQAADRFLETVKTTLDSQQGQAVEYELSTLSGPRHFEGRTQPLAGLINGKRAVVFLARDVSKRWEAEHRQHESDERLSSFYMLGLVGLAITSPDKGVIKANEYLCKLLEYSEQELCGMTWAQFTYPADLAENSRLYERMLSGEIDDYLMEKRFISRSGKIVPARVVVHCTRKADGTVAYVSAMVEDISARKLAEDALRESELRFRKLLQDIPSVSVQGYGRDGITHYWNQASEQLYGYTAEEAIGRNLLDLIIPDEMRDGVREAMRGLFEDDIGIPAGELTLRRKDGSSVAVYSSHARVHVPGQAPEMFCIDIDLSERKAAEDKVRNLAFYDVLTQLPNRRLLLERVQHSLTTSARSLHHGAVLFIDLDNFKTLNDTRGHETGDLLLIQIARRLRTCVREGDMVARLGGDEFVVLLENLNESPEAAAAQAEAISEKILTTLNEDFELAGQVHHSTASVGVTLFAGGNTTVEELLQQADLAMYQAKAAGRDTVRFFDPQMQAVVSARAALEADLRQGLERAEFRLFYQPQVDAGGQVVGAEALIRWQNPQRGWVSPGDFIPAAENSGLILPLGQWVLETACRQLALWAEKPATAELSLAVNVSARQFRQPDFVVEVLAMLDRTGANPQRLKLELTESLLLDDVEGIIAKMSLLRRRGVSFSLDDFGTGYSSLAYLKRLPLNQLKIDQSFVRDILVDSNDAAIAKTVIALSQSLGLSVIAEGVELQAQRDFLAENGCHHYQGYFFGRPMPIEDFDAKLG